MTDLECLLLLYVLLPWLQDLVPRCREGNAKPRKVTGKTTSKAAQRTLSAPAQSPMSRSQAERPQGIAITAESMNSCSKRGVSVSLDGNVGFVRTAANLPIPPVRKHAINAAAPESEATPAPHHRNRLQRANEHATYRSVVASRSVQSPSFEQGHTPHSQQLSFTSPSSQRCVQQASAVPTLLCSLTV